MKGAPQTKRRKVLSIPEEEFFDIVLLLMGPPKREAFDFQFNRFEYGVGAWVKHAPEGRKFMALLESYGEAKSRAGLTYKRYARWCRSNKHDRGVGRN
jgi:hypothetical protein